MMAKHTYFTANRELPVGVGILLLFAITYSYLLVNTLDVHRSLESYPDWQGASWIKAGKISGKGYFRKRFNVSSLPHRAYFIVSGTDKVFVYVNGKIAGFGQYSGARPSMILDVTKLLNIGENLLAVKVNSDIHGVAPELAGRLVLLSASDLRREIISDRSWRVSRYEAFQREGKVIWNSPDYNDLHWKFADIAQAEYSSPSLPMAVPEYVYKEFSSGDWIWSENGEIAILLNEFVVKGKYIHDAWLGVSSAGRYSLVINDVPVALFQGTEKSMEIVNISPYVQLGKNKIWLEVENKLLQPRLLVSGRVTTDHGVVDLDSTDQWRSFVKYGVSSNAVEGATVIVRSAVHSEIATSDISLVYKEIESSGILFEWRMLRVLLVSLVVLLVSLAIFSVFYRINRSQSERRVMDCFSLFARPFVLGLVITGVSLLLRYDPRIGSDFLYQYYILLIVPFVIVLFEAMILLEVHFAGKR